MPAERGTRKLAAIMFTDIKSFSKKMAESEDLAMRLLRVHDDTLKAAIEKYDGKIIKAIGDAFMVDFSSAVNAVKCAIESQQEFYTYNKGKVELEKIEVRIGIHLGDVITDGNDIFGDGVNIAARIEAVTEPNRICISQDVYSQIKNKMQVRTFHMGSIDLKNIPEPMEVYELLMDDIPEFANPSKSAQAMPSKKKAERVTREEAKEAEKVEAAKKKTEDDRQKKERENTEKVETFYEKAQQLLKEGKPGEAEKQLVEVFKHVAFHAGAQMLQARIEEEKHKKADEDRKKASAERKVKQQVGELMEEALKMVDGGNFTDAYKKLGEIYAISPDDEDAKALEARAREEEKTSPPVAEAEVESAQSVETAPQTIGQVYAEPAAEEEHPHERAQPQQRRQAGLKPKEKKLSPVLRNLIVVAVLGLLGFIFYPAIRKILFPKDTTLVIVPFAVPGMESDTTGLGESIAVLLESDLSRYSELAVIRAGNLEGKKPSATQLAANVKAHYVLSGQILSLVPKFSARLRLVAVGDSAPPHEWTVESEPYIFGPLRASVVGQVFQKMDAEAEGQELLPLSSNGVLNALYLQGTWYASHMNRDDVMQGQSILRQVIATDSTFPQAYVALGRAILRQFKIEGERDKSLLRDAADVALKARALNPGIPGIYEVLGSAYRAAGRLSLAARTLGQALELDAGNSATDRQLALLAITEGDDDRALEYASRAATLDPNNAESHEVLGHAYYFKQQLPNAEREYDRAVALGASSYFMTTRYKLAVWGAGLSPEPAAQYAGRLFRDDTTNYVVRYWIGRAYMLSGIWSEARKYLEPGAAQLKELIERSPADVNAHLYLALYYARMGESASGAAEIDKAMELGGETTTFLYRKAQFLAIQTDKKQEALATLQKAVRQEYLLHEVMSPDFAFLLKDPEFNRATSVTETPESEN